ncbi:MAG: hypothetical protein HRU38_17325 [Saccharospirillaceae bacterium]|nr:hypothetical protein [Pseudomonadales bacterium]NRB80400.1 hypothetical protein [Saccharospirillaceae bacterium]
MTDLIAFDNSNCLNNLREQVRYALKPDSSVLIKDWLKFENYFHIDELDKQENLNDQFYLLLETINDEQLPLNWRRKCLKEIFQPLFMLKELEDSVDDGQINKQIFKAQNDTLFNELKQINDEFKRSIGGLSCTFG